MEKEILFKDWNIPFTLIGSGILVGRESAVEAIHQIYKNGYDLLGYDAFRVLTNGKRQPFTAFCADFSKKRCAELAAINSLNGHPEEITHYEFVFRSKA